MNTPRARACFNMSLNGPAISPTRRAADLHQWSSHMSQTIKAVFFASHEVFFSSGAVEPSFRERRVRFSDESAAREVMAKQSRAEVNRKRRGKFIGELYR